MLYKDLVTSLSKFKSIGAILKQSKENLNEALRAVVLLDYIGKEFLDFKDDDTTQLNKMAVVPLFLYLQKHFQFTEDVAVLTGSVVLLPRSVVSIVEAANPLATITTQDVSCTPTHVMLSVNGGSQKLVEIIGQLFAKGAIKIIIGTKALLGEGWDAPSINTLVLASYVGSFVSSNQMRGRAIRKDPNQKDKVAAIWHLACLDPTDAKGGNDIAVLKRRFKAFCGIAMGNQIGIENGLDRMFLEPLPQNQNEIDALNAKMFAKAKKRSAIAENWQEAIAKGSIMLSAMKVPNKGKVGQQRLRALNVGRYLFYQVALGSLLFLPEVLLKNFNIIFKKGYLIFFFTLLFLISLRFLPKLLKAIRIYVKHGNQFKRCKKFAKLLLDVSYDFGYVKTDKALVSIAANQDANGWYSFSFIGVTQQESSFLINCLEELIRPIENPRYVIIQNRFTRFIGFEQFYAVPTAFGKHKKDAAQFAHFWKKHIGRGRLQYVRNVEGRKLLIGARLSHVLYDFVTPPKKINSWK